MIVVSHVDVGAGAALATVRMRLNGYAGVGSALAKGCCAMADRLAAKPSMFNGNSLWGRATHAASANEHAR